MSREVRMVPKDWIHPTDEDGHFIPLYDGGFKERRDEWLKEKLEWDAGIFPDYASEECKKLTFEEWYGCGEPQAEDYMPEFEEGSATYLMMYQTTSEGTPISPAFETPEELARWLVDNEASSFGSMTATYEQWLNTCKRGCSVASMIVTNDGELKSGVEL